MSYRSDGGREGGGGNTEHNIRNKNLCIRKQPPAENSKEIIPKKKSQRENSINDCVQISIGPKMEDSELGMEKQ